MPRSDNDFWFQYPVYNPGRAVIDVVDDWARDIMQGTDDLAWVLQQPFKVAALPVYYNRPDSWSWLPDLVDLDLEQFDLVLFSDPEYHDLQEIRDWIPKSNYVLATGGMFDRIKINDSREVYRPYYIRNFLEQNSYQDSSSDTKPFLFEALLGARRPHRDFVWKTLHRSGLLDRSIVTYRSQFTGSITNYLTDLISDKFGTFMQWPYVSPNLNPNWEVSSDVKNTDSRKSPVEIYKRTWYSIICESQCSGSDFFLSEKTIKAMFNRRIFVMFGPCNFLHNLRLHGFQTFGGCIDETYDTEKRDPIRYEKALQQIWRLAWLEDPKRIYDSMRSVLDANHARLWDLECKRQRDMQRLLVEHIPSRYWNWPPVAIA